MLKRQFPDHRQCRTRYAGGLISCLMTDFRDCSFSLEYGPSVFCLHHDSRKFTTSGKGTAGEGAGHRMRKSGKVRYLFEKRIPSPAGEE